LLSNRTNRNRALAEAEVEAGATLSTAVANSLVAAAALLLEEAGERRDRPGVQPARAKSNRVVSLVRVHRSSRVRQMSEVERAYVGALIDTDGCVWWSKRPAVGWRVTFGNTYIELVAALLRLVGSGSVVSNKGTGFSRKEVLVWRLGAKADVEDLALQCAPYSLKLQRVLGADLQGQFQ
jgi:hypothetical protein